MSQLPPCDVTMLGFRSQPKRGLSTGDSGNKDIAQVFFDTFSRRLGEVESSLKMISSELTTLKVSVDRGQISDLVLLDRLKRAEEFARESIVSIRTSVDKFADRTAPQVEVTAPVEDAGRDIPSSLPSKPADGWNLRIPLQIGEIGSLPSITTATELQVLALLATEGPKSAPEIGKVVGRSREHTSRLMKKLYEEGYIRRDQTRIPFRYSVVERVKQTFEKIPVKGVAKEPISVPQT